MSKDKLFIDQKMMVRQVDERLRNLTDPRHRQLLGVTREHLDAESDMDFDRLFATVAEGAVYHNWVNGRDNRVDGRDAICRLYTTALQIGCTVMEFDITRIVVDNDTVVTEGTERLLCPGRYARLYGVEVHSDDDVYLHRFQQVILWNFNEAGEMIGETFYYSIGASGFEKLRPEQVPDVYYKQFERANAPEFAGINTDLSRIASFVSS